MGHLDRGAKEREGEEGQEGGKEGWGRVNEVKWWEVSYTMNVICTITERDGKIHVSMDQYATNLILEYRRVRLT